MQGLSGSRSQRRLGRLGHGLQREDFGRIVSQSQAEGQIALGTPLVHETKVILGTVHSFSNRCLAAHVTADNVVVGAALYSCILREVRVVAAEGERNGE